MKHKSSMSLSVLSEFGNVAIRALQCYSRDDLLLTGGWNDPLLRPAVHLATVSGKLYIVSFTVWRQHTGMTHGHRGTEFI